MKSSSTSIAQELYELELELVDELELDELVLLDELELDVDEDDELELELVDELELLKLDAQIIHPSFTKKLSKFPSTTCPGPESIQ